VCLDKSLRATNCVLPAVAGVYFWRITIIGQYVQARNGRITPCSSLSPFYLRILQWSTHEESRHHRDSKKSRKVKPEGTYERGAQERSKPTRTEAFTFLFVVHEFQLNEEPGEGGVAPQADQYGNPLPPGHKRGYYPERPGRVFRYRNGEIERALGYEWIREAPGESGHVFWQSQTGQRTQMRVYGEFSVFNCWRLLPCLWTNTDVSVTSMSLTAENRWWALNFEHEEVEEVEGAVTRISATGRYRCVAGRSPDWMPYLIPDTFRTVNSDAPASGGLGGPLGVILGLMALSRRPGRTDEVFSDRMWNRCTLHGERQNRTSRFFALASPHRKLMSAN
jgi:hypothetical protein